MPPVTMKAFPPSAATITSIDASGRARLRIARNDNHATQPTTLMLVGVELTGTMVTIAPADADRLPTLIRQAVPDLTTQPGAAVPLPPRDWIVDTGEFGRPVCLAVLMVFSEGNWGPDGGEVPYSGTIEARVLKVDQWMLEPKVGRLPPVEEINVSPGGILLPPGVSAAAVPVQTYVAQWQVVDDSTLRFLARQAIDRVASEPPQCVIRLP
jgi:hypothetical protein